MSAPQAVPRPRSIRDAELAGKRVLLRSDLNVPLEDGAVADDTRIRAALPTIELLVERAASRVVICSHLGRPAGPDPKLSLRPVARRLGELLGQEVAFDERGARLTLLENTRFNAEETANGASYARELASLGDLYVDDAFGSAHRAHASTVGVAELLPAYAGLLLERELTELGKLLGEVDRPFVLISGGAKVEDKLGVLKHLGRRADTVLIGGKMAEELRDENPFDFAVILPEDVVAASEFAADADRRVTPYDDLPAGWLGLDIGPVTQRRFTAEVGRAKTVFWNGPMGVFEWPRFAEGTKAVARAVADVDGYTVVGGADSARAVNEIGITDRIDWVSTGGGASLEFLEGKELPGVAVIPEA
jgi:phosphoglycerate kinase